MRLITDFDGPIMDVSERYYQVYQFCLAQTRRPEQPVRQLSKAEFWQCKRECVPERTIGACSGLDEEQAKAFARLRRQTVHSLPYLVYDRPVPGAVEALERLQGAGVDLVVLTMRRSTELEIALNRHDLGRFFPPNRRYCLSQDYAKSSDTNDKTQLLERALAELPPDSDVWAIGDTKADIIAAKTHGIRAIGVLSGIRDRDRLSQHQPDLIVNHLGEVVEILLHETVPQFG